MSLGRKITDFDELQEFPTDLNAFPIVNGNDTKFIKGNKIGRKQVIYAIGTTSSVGVNRRVMCQTADGGVYVTLPRALNIGDSVEIVDYDGNCSVNNIYIYPSTDQKIHGEDNLNPLILQFDHDAITLVYSDDAQGWKIVRYNKTYVSYEV